MPTRLYFPNVTNTSIGAAPAAQWTIRSGAAGPGIAVRTKTAVAAGVVAVASSGGGVEEFIIQKRFLTEALPAQILGGTIKGVIKGIQNNAALNATYAIGIRVLSNDASTLKQVALNPVAPLPTAVPPELHTSTRPRVFRDSSGNTDITLGSVPIEENDRLEISFGYRNDASSGYTVTTIFQDDVGVDLDHADGIETNQNADLWVEFSQDIINPDEPNPPIEQGDSWNGLSALSGLTGGGNIGE